MAYTYAYLSQYKVHPRTLDQFIKICVVVHLKFAQLFTYIVRVSFWSLLKCDKQFNFTEKGHSNIIPFIYGFGP